MIDVPLTVSTVVEEAVLVEAIVVVEKTVLADEGEPELEAYVTVVGVVTVKLDEEKEEDFVKLWVAVKGQNVVYCVTIPLTVVVTLTTPVVIGLPLTVKIVDKEAVLVEYLIEVDVELVAIVLLIADFSSIDDAEDFEVAVEVKGQ